MKPYRLAVIGLGHIGLSICRKVLGGELIGVELVFAADNDATRRQAVPAQVLGEIEKDLVGTQPDLVVETAHRSVTHRYGETILRNCDYLPLSLTAFADPNIEQRLREVAAENGKRLFLPHGAVPGIDSIFDGQTDWLTVTIETEKHVDNLRFDGAEELYSPTLATESKIIFSGSARQSCDMFPVNLNAHAAVALAGIGFNDTRSVIKSSPTPGTVRTAITAESKDRTLRIERTDKLEGISGTTMVTSVTNSIKRALAVNGESYWC